jgi:ABC-2 type transport system permease protein
VSVLRIVGAMCRKDFRTAVSYRIGFVTGIVGAFWGLFAFRFVSKLVNTGQFSGNSVSYFRYTVVGLLFASILSPTAAGTSVSVRSEQVQGTLEYLASQPIRRLALGLGWSAFGFLQSLFVAVVILVLTIPLGLLSIVIFAAIGNFGASVVMLVQQGVPLVAGLLSIIGVLSGTLFPITEFPGWLQAIAHLSPLTYALVALRSALLSAQPSTSYTTDLLVLVGFAVVLVPLSAYTLEGAFRAAQRRGSLSTF